MAISETKTGTITPTAAEFALSLSLRLLKYQGLMTPRLTSTFGPIRAEQRSLEAVGSTYLRKSRLISVADGTCILDAELHLVSKNLPTALIASLSETSILFGQLLLDYGMAVDVALPKLFQTSDNRFGRRTSITDTKTARLVCDVKETMAHDSILNSLAAGYENVQSLI
ncbi:hypothetical protein N9571_07020 [Yoonia sp.]|nr:hypothetical protein [Yoonia sp.]